MAHIPVDNKVSLSDSLASFQTAENWADNIMIALAETSSSDQNTIIKGVNDLANALSSINQSLLNPGTLPGIATYEAKLQSDTNAYLQTVPLYIANPSCDYQNAIDYVQPDYNGQPATLYDLVQAVMNNNSGNPFSLSNFDVHGNEAFKDPSQCPWINQGNLNDLGSGGNNSDSTTINGGSVDVNYSCGGGCSPTWTGNATFSAQAMEGISRFNINPADGTSTLNANGVPSDPNSAAKYNTLLADSKYLQN